jgi:hypothetical protein
MPHYFCNNPFLRLKTGNAFGLIGVSLDDAQFGAHANNVIGRRWLSELPKLDSDADQQALTNGWNYKGIILKR